jgi:hypothetical protein
MDAAALMNSCVDMPRSYQSMIMLRTGYITLLGLADSLNIQYPAAPAPDDPISISRDEFDEAYDHLAQAGIPLKSDRDQCWQGFKGWRVNYDHALLGIARFINAPYAQWISDRSLPTTEK